MKLSCDKKTSTGLLIDSITLHLEMNTNKPITGILPRILMKYRIFTGDTSFIDTVQVKYFKTPQTIGLPEGVAALLESSASDERQIKFYNDNETEQVLHVSAENTSLKVDSVEISECTQVEGNLPALKLPANNLAQAVLRLK